MEEEERLDELEMGLETLIEKYGFERVADTLARISLSKQAGG